LVPALILLAIIVAAVIGVAVVWQSAMPSVFRWDYGDHHHYNAYRDGYEQGNKLGVDYARRGDPEPTGQNLDALALREADRLHIRRNRGHWIEGFRNGFTRGFEEFNDQASNQPVSWPRLAERFGETPKPTRETRALPGGRHRAPAICRLAADTAAATGSGRASRIEKDSCIVSRRTSLSYHDV
jgi:hypothetical protein